MMNATDVARDILAPPPRNAERAVQRYQMKQFVESIEELDKKKEKDSIALAATFHSVRYKTEVVTGGVTSGIIGVISGFVLAVLDASAGAHALRIARPDDGSVAHAVPVLEGARQHPGEDLHVAVRVRPEAGAGGDAVIVDDAQRAEAHVAWVLVAPE